MSDQEQNFTSITGLPLDEFNNINKTVRNKLKNKNKKKSQNKIQSYKYIFLDLVKKLQGKICPKNFNDYAITGEFQKFDTQEREDFSLNLSKKVEFRSNWEIILSKMESFNNIYEIPDLAFLFLKRKAYQTVMRLKVHGNRTRKDLNDIINFFIKVQKSQIKRHTKQIDFFLRIFRKKKISFEPVEKNNKGKSLNTKRYTKNFSSTSLSDFSKFNKRTSGTNLNLIKINENEKDNNSPSKKKFDKKYEKSANKNSTHKKNSPKKKNNDSIIKKKESHHHCRKSITNSEFDTENIRKKNLIIKEKVKFNKFKKNFEGIFAVKNDDKEEKVNKEIKVFKGI